MKFTTILLFITTSFLLYSCSDLKTSKSSDNQQSDNSQLETTMGINTDSLLIAQIDFKVLEIKNINNWSDTLEKNLIETTEGGVALFYSFTDKIQKIEVTRYGEMFKYEATYYLENEQLLYLVEELSLYNAPFYFDSLTAIAEGMPASSAFDPSKSEIIVEEFYFKDASIIKSLNNKGIATPQSEEQIKEENLRIQKEFNSIMAQK